MAFFVCVKSQKHAQLQIRSKLVSPSNTCPSISLKLKEEIYFAFDSSVRLLLDLPLNKFIQEFCYFSKMILAEHGVHTCT